MSKSVTAKPPVTVEMAVEVLRKLSPRERLKVIATILPETERELPEQGSEQSQPKRESLRGLWKDLGVDVTAKDIDEVRKEVWKNFPNATTGFQYIRDVFNIPFFIVAVNYNC